MSQLREGAQRPDSYDQVLLGKVEGILSDGETMQHRRPLDPACYVKQDAQVAAVPDLAAARVF
jgi:hypothetical protein